MHTRAFLNNFFNDKKNYIPALYKYRTMRPFIALSLFAALGLSAPAPANKCGTLTCSERAEVINQINDLMKNKFDEGQKITDPEKKLSEQFVLSILRSSARTNHKCSKQVGCNKVPAIAKVKDICKKDGKGKYDCKA
jgi:hypothetical protein